MIRSAEAYRAKRMGAVEPYIAGLALEKCDIAVCIPAVNEFPNVLDAVDSLAAAWRFYRAAATAEAGEDCAGREACGEVLARGGREEREASENDEARNTQETRENFQAQCKPESRVARKAGEMRCGYENREALEETENAEAQNVLDLRENPGTAGKGGNRAAPHSPESLRYFDEPDEAQPPDSRNFPQSARGISQVPENAQARGLPQNCGARCGFARLLIVVNVNNRPDAGEAVRRNNESACNALREKAARLPRGLRLVAVDSFSRGREIPQKDGAGFARKIALDYGYLCGGADAVLCCMDADTFVDQDYFCAIDAAFCRTKARAGTLDFAHRLDGTPAENRIIAEYEAYLKRHARRLEECGSPWHPVALGPTLVCRAEAYAACGGMNRHVAGEDFYYLQSLLKTCAVGEFCRIESCVHPSPRVSDRVPFGTGAAVKGAIEGTHRIKDFDDSCFDELSRLLACAAEFCASAESDPAVCAGDFFAALAKRSPNALLFLRDQGFEAVWQKLFAQNRKSAAALNRAFHCWFDGLKTIRFFHWLSGR